jgi:tRNA (cmo5U34)-methyltransferase
VQLQREHHEDWFDDQFVEGWIEEQGARKTERERQFARIAALVPRHHDEPFRYLNVGAGPGPLDALLLSRFPRAEATLLDGSPVMLEHARAELATFEGRASFVQANLAESDWAAGLGPFDLAVSSIAIHNLRESRLVRTLYADVFDLLAEGGFFMNLDYVRMASTTLGPLGAWAAQDADAGFLRVGGGGGRAPVRRGGGGGAAGTVEENLVWLREAGFAPVDCFWREFRVALFGGFKGEVHVPELTPNGR